MTAKLIPELLAEHGDRPFVVTDDGEYSFAEIEDRARRFASLLRTQGVARGDHIALLAGNHAAYLVAWFGITMAGAVTVALNNQLIAGGLCYSLVQSAAKMIVADRAWMDQAYGHLTGALRALPLLVIEDERIFLNSLDAHARAVPDRLASGDTATILYTSGTTGLPKGVMNSHAAYAATGLQTVRLLGLTSEDRILLFLPLFHVNPQMFAVMSALTAGCGIALRPRFSAASFFDDARRFGATGCTYVGTILTILANRHSGEVRDHGLRFGFGGGAPIEIWRAIESRFGIRLHEAYGMTELGGWTSANGIEDRRIGTAGKVRDDIEIRVVDPHDHEVAIGEKGEIVGRPRRPDVILSGYWDKPDKLAEATRNLWFHSGDIGSFDADGYLTFHGRMKELIRRGGEMVSPVEVETRLLSMPGVEDCAIVGVSDSVMDEEIKAVLVASVPIEPSAVRTYLAAHFPAYMLPRYVEFLKAIPKTETQKVQRNRLTDLGPGVVDLRA
jgi:acyl-CoA synthetase (AMP-forming)/AMP-acid ligase II